MPIKYYGAAYKVKCDGGPCPCSEWGDFEVPSTGYAELELKNIGWSVTPKRALCPECAKKIEEKGK